MRLGPALFALACWLVVACLVAVSCAPAQAGTRLHVTDYDAYIERGSLRWIPEHDWRWLRAQCYQESRFQPRAVSPANAQGLCQFLPGTWGDARRAIGVRDVFSPSENAYAAGWYMRRMIAIWTSERTDMQRLQLAQASYNAGAGNIIQAQRVCDGALDWETISTCLPQVTGRHSAETIDYVKRIRRWYWEQPRDQGPIERERQQCRLGSL